MSVLAHALRPGAYRDSIVLMQLRAALEEEPGVLEAGAAMASPENLALLEASGLLPELSDRVGPSDLLVVVRAEGREAAEAALERVDALIARDRAGPTAGDYRPRSLAAAVRSLPAARWVLVSVPGPFAPALVHEALGLGRHVFLFSDHVPLEEEISLKRIARSRGLLVMGPDCGTAIVRGVGFGFANRVRRGGIGIVAASGTGLQAVACGIHARGGGISHAIGTGGRDLSAEVGGVTALQGLELLAGDPDTRVIVLVSKPPAPRIARRVLAAAEATGKPVVARFVGGSPSGREAAPLDGGVESAVAGPVAFSALHLARDLDHAAELAVRLAADDGDRTAHLGDVPPAGGAGRPWAGWTPPSAEEEAPAPRGFLRGLFAGGTLAQEALSAAARFLTPGSLHTNLEGVALPLADPGRSRRNTILDLGADLFTAGRAHPMLDQEARLRRLREEAADPETGYLLLDVVLGDGAHADPAAELAPEIERVRAGGGPQVGVVLIGTELDPQDLERQAARLAEAGARLFRDVGSAIRDVRACLAPPDDQPPPGSRDEPAHDEAPAGRGVPSDEDGSGGEESPAGHDAHAGADDAAPPVDPEALRRPVAAINVGLEAFHRSLAERDVPVLDLDWRPPAGGDARLADALRRLRG